jgi:hypothetical protein
LIPSTSLEINMNLLTLAEFAKTPDCPWTVSELRRRLYRARPTRDSQGRAVDKGDPEFLSCFSQLTPRSPILVNVDRWRAVMERRSLAMRADLQSAA